MSMSDTSENNLLLLLFNNANWANVGDATGLRGSTTAGSFFINLHTGSLTDTATQATNIAAYGGYTGYVAVARASGAGGWSVSGTNPTVASNVSAVTFQACTSGSETDTGFTCGRASSGAGEALFIGLITSPGSGIAVSTGITPAFAAGQLTCAQD